MNAQTCLTDADFGRLCEGDVTAKQRGVFERHLDACSQCKARWEKVAAGARYVEGVLSGAKVIGSQTKCPSQDLLAGYLDDSLDAAEKRLVSRHLAECRTCQEQVQAGKWLSGAYTEEGGEWWNRYIGQQILHLVACAPEVLSEVLAAAKVGQAADVKSEAIIRLPILEPAEAATLRMAAATGDGFSEQILRQDEPPFEFHVVQFGEQIRVTVRTLEEASPYKDCLARLRLFEGDFCRLSRYILLEDGQGRCTVEPEEAQVARPKKERLRVDLEPVVGVEQLAAAGSEAYVPILERLLKHGNASLRTHAVEILARILGPKAGPLIEPLASDPDETVRAAVRRAMTLAERKHG
jgi:hypothetical protein